MYALVGVVALLVAVYVGLWLYWGFAFTLAGLPLGTLPGIHVPLYLLFAAAIILAAVVYRIPERRFHRMGTAVLILLPWQRSPSSSPASVSVRVPVRQIVDHHAGGGGVDALVEKDLERFARICLSITANTCEGID
jgi:hypothetical protein